MARTLVSTPTRLKVNNFIYNGDFEYAPSFTAATTTSGRWIDGAAGGSLTNSIYGWALNKSGTVSAQYDSSTSFSGSNSMKVSTIATNSNCEVSNSIGTTTANMIYCIPVTPSTSYTLAFYMKTNYTSGDSNNGAAMQISERGITGSNTATSSSTFIKTTTNFTQYTLTTTMNASTRFVLLKSVVSGNSGTATLIMDAWFDNVTFGLTTPQTRTIAGNRILAGIRLPA